MTVDVNITQITNELPSEWSQLLFEDYLYIMNNLTEDGVSNQYMILNRLTGLELDVLHSIPYVYLNPMLNKIRFVYTLYVPTGKEKSTLNLKDYKEIVYDDFVTTIQSQNLLTDLPTIIKVMSKDPLTIEQINKMNVKDLQEGFFLYRKKLKKSLKRSVHSMKRQILKEKVMKFFHLQEKDKNKSLKLEIE